MLIYRSTRNNTHDIHVIAGEMINVEAGKTLFRDGKQVATIDTAKPHLTYQTSDCEYNLRPVNAFILVTGLYDLQNIVHYLTAMVAEFEDQLGVDHMGDPHSVLSYAHTNIKVTGHAKSATGAITRRRDITCGRPLERARFTWHIRRYKFGDIPNEFMFGSILYDLDGTIVKNAPERVYTRELEIHSAADSVTRVTVKYSRYITPIYGLVSGQKDRVISAIRPLTFRFDKTGKDRAGIPIPFDRLSLTLIPRGDMYLTDICSVCYADLYEQNYIVVQVSDTGEFSHKAICPACMHFAGRGLERKHKKIFKTTFPRMYAEAIDKANITEYERAVYREMLMGVEEKRLTIPDIYQDVNIILIGTKYVGFPSWDLYVSIKNIVPREFLMNRAVVEYKMA